MQDVLQESLLGVSSQNSLAVSLVAPCCWAQRVQILWLADQDWAHFEPCCVGEIKDPSKDGHPAKWVYKQAKERC